MTKLTSFQKWFRTFLEEKKIDMSEILVHEGDKMVQVGDVCQAIFDTSAEEQAKIKTTIVFIDFSNGNVYKYFKHLSQAL